MMTCRELMELLVDFVSGELTEDQVQQIQAHLDDCPPCVTIIETYRLTIWVARLLPRQPLPQSCEQRLRAAVAQAWKQQSSGNT
jgi:anti-sigma factor RsiW